MHALIVIAHHDSRSLTHSLAAQVAKGVSLTDPDNSFEIDLFGSPEKVGFYNTFTAMTDRSKLQYVEGMTIEVSHDARSGEVHALRGPLFASFQFHPESVLTQHGAKILGTAICDLLK